METKVLNQNKSEKKNNKWQKVMIAGIPAIALGGAIGAYAARQEDEVVNDDTTTENSVASAHETVGTATYDDIELSPIGDIPAASAVNNDMNFGDAFAAARQEVGAGGVFEWRGGVYGTYTQTEWAALSDEDKLQFSSEALGIPYEPEQQEELVADTVVEPQPTTEEVAEVVEPLPEPQPTTEEVAEVVEPLPEPGSQPMPEIDVVAQEHWQEDGNQYTLSEVHIDGEQYVLIDENGGTVELMATDINSDGEISEDEIAVITDLNIQQEDLDTIYAHTYGQEGYPYPQEEPTNDNLDYLADDATIEPMDL